ncbi:unnamed protein product [marine sediment metagenome]|uniref:Uncharacterized protein n=1 Tax=marine sediment metagenome TaxID=412755 RepID=X0XX08_9ZZZZ
MGESKQHFRARNAREQKALYRRRRMIDEMGMYDINWVELADASLRASGEAITVERRCAWLDTTYQAFTEGETT